MEDTKYIGMDVHKDSISIAVLNSSGKLVMECVIDTKAIAILEFLHGLRGSLHLTFEEGTWAAWLYDLLKPHVAIGHLLSALLLHSEEIVFQVRSNDLSIAPASNAKLLAPAGVMQNISCLIAGGPRSIRWWSWRFWPR